MPEPTEQQLNDEPVLRLHGRQAYAEAVTRLLGEAAMLVQLLSHDLDPELYAGRDAVDALRALCLRHRQARVELLVADARRTATRASRLREFARMLTSRVQLRELAEEHREETAEMLIIDGRVLLSRPSADSLDALLQRQPSEARIAQRRFAELWEHASPARELTTLGI